MSAQDIIIQLGALSAKDLQLIKMTTDHLLKGSPTQSEEENENDELSLFYVQIAKALAVEGINCLPWPIFKRSSLYRDLRNKFPLVEEYTQKYFGRLNRRHRQRLYSIYATVTINWINANPVVPLTVKTFIGHINRISEFMANAFPGYSENGWMVLILELENKKNGAVEES